MVGVCELSYSSAEREVPAGIEPSTEITDGLYVTSSGYFLENRLTVTRWAEDFYLRSSIRYKNGYVGSFNLPIEHLNQNNFKSKGSFRIEIEGKVCNYAIELDIRSYKNALYIRDYSPKAMPTSLDNYGYCPYISPSDYEWLLHPEPYLLQMN